VAARAGSWCQAGDGSDRAASRSSWQRSSSSLVKTPAEIPGLEEKDVEVLIDDGVLTLKGEKRSETEDKEKQFSERFYGRFERRIPLGVEVEEDKIDARFKSGVLSIVLPKSAKAQSQVKRIAIKS